VDYVDFTIRIRADGEGRYCVDAQCLDGDARGEEFVPPYAPEDLTSFFWGALEAEPSRELGSTSRGSVVVLEEVGDRLFQALMPPAVRARFDGCRGKVEAEGNGLRIKLCLDPTDPRVSWLSLLPWEAVYRKDRQEFLGLNRGTPISRYLDAPYPLSPVPFTPPLRILVVKPNPEGVSRLDLDRERLQLCQSWGEGSAAEVDLLDRAMVDTLRDRLCERWDVLHFMGHGGFDQQKQEGYLVFESEDGYQEQVRDQRFAILLQGTGRPRLVVLNACATARVAADGIPGTVTGAAPALVRAGIPAVVAMLLPISDRAAILFSRVLHTRLAAGDPVDVAVTEGRRAVRDQMGLLEWIKPVLFMRVPDGRLFETPQSTLLPQIPGDRNIAEVSVSDEIEADVVVLGGVVNEGPSSGDSASGHGVLRAKKVKTDRFIFGGKVNLKGDS
jgi:hypothetical protein